MENWDNLLKRITLSTSNNTKMFLLMRKVSPPPTPPSPPTSVRERDRNPGVYETPRVRLISSSSWSATAPRLPVSVVPSTVFYIKSKTVHKPLNDSTAQNQFLNMENKYYGQQFFGVTILLIK